MRHTSTPSSEVHVPGWTLPRPTPPRFHQAPPHLVRHGTPPRVQHLEIFPSGVPPLSPRATSPAARLLPSGAAAPAARCSVSCRLQQRLATAPAARRYTNCRPAQRLLPSSCRPQHRLLPPGIAALAARHSVTCHRRTVNCRPAHELSAVRRSGSCCRPAPATRNINSCRQTQRLLLSTAASPKRNRAQKLVQVSTSTTNPSSKRCTKK